VPSGSVVSEREFLAGYDVAAFQRPSLAVDVVLVAVRGDALVTLLIERSEHPFRGRTVLPGGFVHMDESLEDAALRVLREKGGLTNVFLEQLHTFGDVRRDPRTRVVSVAYMALVASERFPDSEEDAQRITARIDVPWAEQAGGPVDLLAADGAPLEVGFDHAEIVGMAVKRLRGKLSYAPIGYQLLSERFTLLELQCVHEVILGRELNKDSFRRKMLASGELEATGRRELDVGHRPAELYRFRQRSAL
jgi:8-oxo-dGTP diphosphatase